MQQFIMRLHACVELKCRYNVEESMMILCEALALSQKKKKEEQMSFVFLSGNELCILNDIAICEYKMGNCDKAIVILKQILHMDVVETDKTIERSKIKMIYNVSLFLMRLKKEEEALLYTKRGIQACVDTMVYSYLFPLYYNLAILYLLQGNDIEFKTNINISYTLALTQNKINIFLDALKEDIEQFNVPKEIYEKYGGFANYK